MHDGGVNDRLDCRDANDRNRFRSDAIITVHCRSTMMGDLYDRALQGERCWIRQGCGAVRTLPIASWLGEHAADDEFDGTVMELCEGVTIDLGCGPGRLAAQLVRRGIPALGVDQSAVAVALARRCGAPALNRDIFDPLPATGQWQTALIVDGNVGIGGDPRRVLRRAAELLCSDGHCVVEFDAAASGLEMHWVRLESAHAVGPWFRWASVGMDCADELAEEAGLSVKETYSIGTRFILSLAAR